MMEYSLLETLEQIFNEILIQILTFSLGNTFQSVIYKIAANLPHLIKQGIIGCKYMAVVKSKSGAKVNKAEWGPW